MSEECHVYGLICPVTNQLHYIGSTANPVARLACHISEPTRGVENRKNKWIKSLRDKSLKPEMFIIETTDYKNRFECEYFWIDYFKMVNADLFNILGVFKKHKTGQYTQTKNITPTRKMVKPLREKTGLSQGQFAREIRTTKKIINMWENDEFHIARDITIKLFIKLHKKWMIS